MHKDGSIKAPMNVTVSLLSHFSVNYDIQVMAVLLGDAGFYQTMRLQCQLKTGNMLNSMWIVSVKAKLKFGSIDSCQQCDQVLGIF